MGDNASYDFKNHWRSENVNDFRNKAFKVRTSNFHPQSSNRRRSTNPLLYRNPDGDPRGPYQLTSVTSSFERRSLQYEWHGCFPPAGRSWKFTSDRAAELDADDRIKLSRDGRPWLKRYLSEDVTFKPRSVLEHIVQAAMKEIVIAIAENPECIRDVEWRDLERALREVFEKLGFITRLTRSGKDGGFDLELKYTEAGKQKTVLVEVKHWAGSGKKPGKPIFHSFVNVVAKAMPGTAGLLLSSTGFTSELVSGRTEIEGKMIRLGGRSKIVSLCRSYLQSTEGLWTPIDNLTDLLLAGTQ